MTTVIVPHVSVVIDTGQCDGKMIAQFALSLISPQTSHEQANRVVGGDYCNAGVVPVDPRRFVDAEVAVLASRAIRFTDQVPLLESSS